MEFYVKRDENPSGHFNAMIYEVMAGGRIYVGGVTRFSAAEREAEIVKRQSEWASRNTGDRIP